MSFTLRLNVLLLIVSESPLRLSNFLMIVIIMHVWAKRIRFSNDQNPFEGL